MCRYTIKTVSVYVGLSVGVIVAILAVFVENHDRRLETLDSLSTHLEEQVENLTKQNEKLTKIMDHHERRLKTLDSLSTNLEEQNEKLTKIIDHHDGRLETLDSLSTHLEKQVEILTKENEKLRETIDGYSKKVAFTVGMHTAGGTGNGHTLVFPVVINNEGGGYNPSTGEFTAPRDGQYIFFVSAQGYNSDTLYVSIVHNGSPKVMTMSDGGRKKDFYDSGTNLVALNLKNGDKVWAQCQSGSTYYSEGIAITTFTGFLV